MSSKLDEYWAEGFKIGMSQDLPLEHTIYFAWAYVAERVEDMMDRMLEEKVLENADEESV